MRDGGMMLLAAIICTALVLMGHLDRTVGAGLVAILVAYIYYCYRRERLTSGAPQSTEAAGLSWFVALLAFVGGLALTIYGARLLVFAAIELARAAGISETILGLTVVAVGTSLPELVTSVMAGVRRQSAVAFGNILGSNIYNVFGILGVTALVQPIGIPAEIAQLDIWVMLGATMLLLIIAVSNWVVSRWQGAAFLTAYAAYLGHLARIA